MQRFVARYRIAITRVLFAVLVGLIVLTHHRWADPGLWSWLSGTLGFLAIIAAALGRLWCSLYISGYKSRRVVSDGPYSMVRNPLYVFSLIGAVGIGLVTHSLLVIVLLLVIFGGLYPLTIAEEEAKLERALGKEYLAYKARTPRFVPDPSKYANVNTYTINIPQMQSAFLDAIWFPIGYIALQGLADAQRSSIAPVLAYLP